jgi:glucosamine--fructose-6-phosphate aminotransferase (isomerizing)
MSHFWDEIAEQPEVASRLLARSRDAVAHIGDRIRDTRPRGYVIAARGSSDHAALYAKYLFGVRNRALVALAAPSLFTHYASPPNLEGQCVIGISQSGASPDVISVIEEARRQGALTIAISNDAESSLAKAAELVLPLEAGPERSVPASKTYTASLLALALISQAVNPDEAFGGALSRVPQAMASALEMDSDVEKLVPLLSGTRAIVLGRGFNFSTAEELALKLMETSYVMARAWSVADFEHGPIAVLEAGLPVVVVDGGGVVATQMRSIRERVGAKGCHVLQLVDGELGDVDRSTAVGLRSGLPEELTPISLAVLAQLLAHHVAVARGFDPDSPREIRKVTRTW